MGQMKDLALRNTTALTPLNDGWDDAAAEDADRLIRGTLLRFRDFRWYAGKQAVLVEDGTRLIARATLALWQLWEDGKVVDKIIREPGKFLPARETLGHLDKTEWEKGQDPWQNTRLVHLLHPVSAAEYSFSTSSGGGRSAVSTLAGAIKRMRRGQPNAVPVVELRSEPMPTQYGPKSKPRFEIVEWKVDTTGATALPASVDPKLTAADDDFGGDDPPDPNRARDLDDQIPF